MLKLTVVGQELFNEETSEFIIGPDFVLELEHSLVSLSKWESKFQKPFLSKDQKSPEEVLAYIEFMILTEDLPENLMLSLTREHFDVVQNYIDSAESATTFGQLPKQRGRGETITSELVYYWLVAFQIPFEVERWHLNRLFALIRICNLKNQKPEKQSKGEKARQFRELNEKRRAQYGTTG